jgi:hypothetical protein
MEYKRRTLSSALDDFPNDIEKQSTHRPSISVDDTIDDYTEYVYNGTFNLTKIVYRGLINLICPCCCRNRKPIEVK